MSITYADGPGYGWRERVNKRGKENKCVEYLVQRDE